MVLPLRKQERSEPGACAEATLLGLAPLFVLVLRTLTLTEADFHWLFLTFLAVCSVY